MIDARDSQIGMMIGLAIGDAMGAPIEFTSSREPEDYVTSYLNEWKAIENQFDQNSPLKPKENTMPSMSGFCLSDFYIIQKWIDYAKGLEDPSSKEFEDHPIVFNQVFDIAVLRKAKFGKNFLEKTYI